MTFERILAVKLADFGDALLMTPALRALRAAYPGATIDALTTPGAADVYRHSGLVDEVLVFDKARYDGPGGWLRAPLVPFVLGRRLRARRYGAVALFHHLTTRAGAVKHAGLVLASGAPARAGLARPGAARAAFLNRRAADLGYDARHEVEAALAVAAALGAPAKDRSLAFVPGARAEARATALLATLDAGGPWVALHPGSGPYSPARRWLPERFAEVADGLAASGARVVLVGTPADGTADVAAQARAPVLDLTGRTDLPTLAAVLARMDLFVGNDSGVTHLATAMGTPVVAVFGPSNAIAWGPWWPETDAQGPPSPHRVVGLPLPCRPCMYRGHALGEPRGCPTRDCLTWLPSGRVLEAALDALARAGRSSTRLRAES